MSDIKKIKPSLPKGTRDFLPEEVARRNYIFDTIKSVFRKYGFQQIDTPAFERLETLTGKYGEEGDRLLFKILNSGNPFQGKSKEADNIKLLALGDIESINAFLKNQGTDQETFDERKFKTILSSAILPLAEKGLRYDLTIPLARYVVQHQEHLAFPFKRFHIGPVWRADRPQKGRYQEFYQCDADVIGSTSLLNEVELTQIYVEVFDRLGICTYIFYSSRKFLYGIAQYCLAEKNFEEFISILDKTDKVGYIEVRNLLNSHFEFGKNGTGDKYWHLITHSSEIGSDEDKMKFFYDCFNEINSTEGIKGLEEMKFLYNKHALIKKEKSLQKLLFTLQLTRGLDYYSGIVWEVIVNNNVSGQENIKIGSLGGGGRYDNLTEMFGGRDMSGVGISFGIERIYDVMEELGLFPAELAETTKVLFVHFDEASEAYAFEQLQKARAADIASEIYPGKKKLDKQMNYANDKKIPYVVVVGGDEMASGKLTFKNMASGEQEKLTIEEIIERLKPND